MANKAAAIINPFAGKGKARKIWPKYRSTLAKNGIEISEVFSEKPGHAADLTRQTIQRGTQIVIAVGGDGTVNEVVNGFGNEKGVFARTASLAVVAAGTGQDLARTLKVPNRPEDLAESIIKMRLQNIDVGKLSYRRFDNSETENYFVNISDFGFGGLIAKNINGFPRYLGNFLAYISGLVVTLFTHKNPKVVFQIDDGEEVDGRHLAVLAANGQYFGGGMWVAPEAKLDDGLFEFALVGNVGKLDVLRNLPKLYNGKLFQHPKVVYLKGKKLVARSDEEVLIDMDGEAPGKLPARFEIIPNAVRVHV